MKNVVKRITVALGILALLIVFSACGEDVPTEKTVWLPYTMSDYYENCKYTYYYDEYGNQIKETKEDADGNLKATWIYEYDSNHNLIKRSVDTGDGELFVQLLQVYDANGNLIEKREFSTSSETVYMFVYDEQNRCVSKSSGNELIEIYSYEQDGSYRVHKMKNADEYSLYGADGKILERHLSDTSKWVYCYNENGVLIECAVYSGDSVTRTTVYQLDEYGNTVKVVQVDASGTEKVVGEYEYKQYTVKVK